MLVSFCNLTVLILFSLFVKAWGKITVNMIVKLEPEINLLTTYFNALDPPKEQLENH